MTAASSPGPQFKIRYTSACAFITHLSVSALYMCVSMSVSLLLCLSVPVCLSVCMSFFLYVSYVFLYVSVDLLLYVCVSMFVCISLCLTVFSLLSVLSLPPLTLSLPSVEILPNIFWKKLKRSL